jgi:hypothetical protein
MIIAERFYKRYGNTEKSFNQLAKTNLYFEEIFQELKESFEDYFVTSLQTI